MGDSQGWEFSRVPAVSPLLHLVWAAHMQPMCPLGNVRRHRDPNGNIWHVAPCNASVGVVAISTKPNLEPKSPVVS